MNVASLKAQVANLPDDAIVLVGDHTLQVLAEGRYVDLDVDGWTSAELTESGKELGSEAATKLARLPFTIASMVWYRVLETLHAKPLTQGRFQEILEEVRGQ